MTLSSPTALLILSATLAGCSGEAQADATPAPQRAAQAPDTPAAATTATRRVTIPIEGMACDSCAEHLQAQLARIDGVHEATVDFDKKEARVKFDPAKVATKKLVAEINKAFAAGEPRPGDA